MHREFFSDQIARLTADAVLRSAIISARFGPAGKLVWAATDFWGRIRRREGTATDGPGEWHDIESGLQYGRHRYYDPDIARCNLT